MGARIRDRDWSDTQLGGMADWSPTLHATLGICLHSAFPTAIYWGDAHHLFYNDAWTPIVGDAHPHALGRPAHEGCADSWVTIAPHVARVRRSGQGVATRDAPLAGAQDELYWDYSLAPITEPDGSVGGVLSQGQETTARVHAARRHTLLATLDDAMREAPTATATLEAALASIGAALGVDCAGTADIHLAERIALVAPCWTNGALPEIAGVHRLGGADDRLIDALAHGRSYAIEDAVHDPRLSDDSRARYAAHGIRATLIVPIRHDDDQLTVLFLNDRRAQRWPAHRQALAAAAGERLTQALAHTRTGSALRNAAERHRLIFERTGAILFSADRLGRLTACNPAAARAFGRPAAALVLHPLETLLAPDGYARLTAALADARRDGGTATIDVAVPHGARTRDWEVAATPAIDPDHDGGFHAVARDVTARHAIERQQRVLINELNHRVKNTLALVQGLAYQTFRPDRDIAASRATFEARLSALARVHDLLTAANWDGAALDTIVEAATRPQRDPPARIQIAGPPLTIAPKPAIALTLALHELATNAAAYGALRIAAGRVAIGWTIADGRLRLSWRETGGGAAIAPRRPGFGLRMIQRVLAADFGGAVRLDFTAAGFACMLDAPVPAAIDAAGSA